MSLWQTAPSSATSLSLKHDSNTLRFLQIALLLASLVLSSQASADFDKAMRFYDQALYTHALNAFIDAAEKGDARAQLMAGRLYEDGRGGDYDPEQAHTWYQKAANQGLAEGQYLLGMQYLKQSNQPRHQVDAIGWIKKQQSRD